MRKLFPWYFVADEDYDTVWAKGVLTVDTNVMLDLYRYNKTTREALLVALESFSGRFWISHQTATEFVKNRRVVIGDMSNDFSKAKKPVDDVEKTTKTAVDAIRACRVIPKELSEAFEADILKSCKTIRDGIEKERTEIPDYEVKDEVVQRLEAALVGCIGSQPDDIEDDLKEAHRRKEAKIPPGYMDDSKDGLGFAGDYLMWKQIISHGEKNKTPIILVTSETKEDWWEKKSGKTLNPRLELLQEAFEKTGHRFLIYHTDQFLRIHQKRSGDTADETVFAEIREYSLAREPAVSVVQEVDSASGISNTGKLRISISRSVKSFTGTGRFDPKLAKSPEVLVSVVGSPDDASNVWARANTGTNHDFNVHVHPGELGKMMPVGEYIIEYEASCSALSEDTKSEEVAE